MNINIGNLINQIAEFLGNLGDFLQRILFYEFRLFGIQVNTLNLMFLLGIGTLIAAIIIKIFI